MMGLGGSPGRENIKIICIFRLGIVAGFLLLHKALSLFWCYTRTKAVVVELFHDHIAIISFTNLRNEQ